MPGRRFPNASLAVMTKSLSVPAVARVRRVPAADVNMCYWFVCVQVQFFTDLESGDKRFLPGRQ